VELFEFGRTLGDPLYRPKRAGKEMAKGVSWRSATGLCRARRLSALAEVSCHALWRCQEDASALARALEGQRVAGAGLQIPAIGSSPLLLLLRFGQEGGQSCRGGEQ
jgi:hypothetical protein